MTLTAPGESCQLCNKKNKIKSCGRNLENIFRACRYTRCQCSYFIKVFVCT